MAAYGFEEPLFERLDPTRPDRWTERTARGMPAFIARWGVLAFGLPASVLLDLGLLARGGAMDLLFTTRHAVQLELLTIIVAPVIGAVVGRALWAVGERRYHQRMLEREFLAEPGPPPAPPGLASPPPESQFVANPRPPEDAWRPRNRT